MTAVYNPTDITLPELQVGVIVALHPSGVTFAPPVTVEFPYNDPLPHVLGIDEVTLRINSFEPSTLETEGLGETRYTALAIACPS